MPLLPSAIGPSLGYHARRMVTSRSVLTLAFVTLGLIGCTQPGNAPPAKSADETAAKEAPVQSGSPEGEAAVAEESKKSKAPGEGDGSAPPPASKDEDRADRAAASTEIITVADAGAGSIGRDTQVDSPEVPPEADPDEQTSKSDERPPLPKPVFGDTAKTSCRKQLEVGNKVKSFKLASVDGKKTISSSGYRGRVMLLNFWATWCKPCIKELPDLDRLYRKYRNNGMTLVAIATDEDAAAVQVIVDDLKLAARVAISGEKAAGEYDHPNFPFSFVVDGEGKIVAAYDKIDENCLADLESVLRDELERLD